MDNLSLVPTGDLIEELSKRQDNIVIIGDKVLDDGRGELLKHVKGDPITCLGLLEVIKPSMYPETLYSDEGE